MILAALAILLAAGLSVGRLGLPAAARRRVVVVLAATAATVLILGALRLTPLALLVFLAGGGFAVNAAIRGRSAAGGYETAFDDAAPPPRGRATMDRQEALAVLGLSGEPTAEEVKEAHRRMIVRAHPDQGGSDYLASKVNEAKGILLPKD